MNNNLRKTDFVIAAFLLLSTLVAMFFTSNDMGMAWDEGITIMRERKVAAWVGRVLDGNAVFDQASIEQAWPFAREEPDGHPSFYAILGLAGWYPTHMFVDSLVAYRVGPIVLFCMTVSVLFLFMSSNVGRSSGLVAALGWFLMPRVFAHAHLASYDIPLSCLWMLTTIFFWQAIRSWESSRTRGMMYAVLFALVLSAGLATKFTGWLIPLPLLAWTFIELLRRRPQGMFPALALLLAVLLILGACLPKVISLHGEIIQTEDNLAGSSEDGQSRSQSAAKQFRSVHQGGLHPIFVLIPCLGVAGVWFVSRSSGRDGAVHVWTIAASMSPVFTLLWIPSWWHDPLRGVSIFLWSNLSRESTTWIPTLFFGKVYEFGLPWYNTMAWVFLTIPPLMLALILVGLAAPWCRARRLSPHVNEAETKTRSTLRSLALLIILNASTLLVIRATPSAPGHDGARQLLPCFPFLAVLGGIGIHEIARWLGQMKHVLRRLTLGVIMLLTVGSAGWSLCRYHPLQLSYYTEIIGGLRGAAEFGLEPTYYWDALDQSELSWLNQNTGSTDWVLFNTGSRYNFEYLKEWGKLRIRPLPIRGQKPRWYVLQNRPGHFRPRDLWLIENGVPARTRAIQGVPLIWIYPIEEYDRAVQATNDIAEPSANR